MSKALNIILPLILAASYSCSHKLNSAYILQGAVKSEWYYLFKYKSNLIGLRGKEEEKTPEYNILFTVKPITYCVYSDNEFWFEYPRHQYLVLKYKCPGSNRGRKDTPGGIYGKRFGKDYDQGRTSRAYEMADFDIYLMNILPINLDKYSKFVVDAKAKLY